MCHLTSCLLYICKHNKVWTTSTIGTIYFLTSVLDRIATVDFWKQCGFHHFIQKLFFIDSVKVWSSHFLQAALCLHAKGHSFRWSAGICPHCYKSECDLGVLLPDMITLVNLSWKTRQGPENEELWLMVCFSSCWTHWNVITLEQDWFLVVTDTLNKTMILLMFFVSLKSPSQLAEELQSKPLNSEIRELLKLLSKPNLKVRMCCLHLLKWTLVHPSQFSKFPEHSLTTWICKIIWNNLLK